MVYIPFDPNAPAGTDTPPIYAGDDLSNIRALRDAVVCGFMPGWSYALDVANPPLYAEWTAPGGQIKFRLIQTYGSGTPAYVNSARWDYSENAGGAWTVISTGGTASAITTNSVGSILTVDKDAGMWVLALSAFNRNRYSEYAGDTHAALVGTAAHGLGTMATQSASAVAITGGNVQGTKAQLLTRLSPSTPVQVLTGTDWDWAATPTQCWCLPGTVINNLANTVQGEMKRMLVAGAGAITLPGIGSAVVFATGHPAWGTVGTIVNVVHASANSPFFVVTTIPY